jgi:hypothetical protein
VREHVERRQGTRSAVYHHFALTGGYECRLEPRSESKEQACGRGAQDDEPEPRPACHSVHQCAREKARREDQLRHGIVVRAVAHDGGHQQPDCDHGERHPSRGPSSVPSARTQD